MDNEAYCALADPAANIPPPPAPVQAFLALISIEEDQDNVKNHIEVSNNEDGDNNTILSAAANMIEAALAMAYLNNCDKDRLPVPPYSSISIGTTINTPVLNGSSNLSDAVPITNCPHICPTCLATASPVKDDRWYTVMARRSSRDYIWSPPSPWVLWV
ncbi:hypothetical protein C0995_002543 [Termitomyces sp. Mi166|nr:hypothetical protein C0995_002543 [Termitomyces sp. Mi166\